MDFSREISAGIARERKNTRLRTSQLLRALPRWLWKFRKDLTHPNDLTFPLTRVVLYFSFPLSYEKNELLIRGFSCVVQIDSMCLKMWSKQNAVVKCDTRAPHRLVSCCAAGIIDSLIPVYYHLFVFEESEYSDIRHK